METPMPPPDTNVKQAVPFFWVLDIERSLCFYVDGLGFEMTKQWRDEGRLRWCWLVLDEVALMLQEFGEKARERQLPQGALGTGVSINFVCEDAVALWKKFTSRGLAAARPFVGNGMWVTEVTDPDGYRLYFESPTDAPEESVFADEKVTA